jgi:hypothetical protein
VTTSLLARALAARRAASSADVAPVGLTHGMAPAGVPSSAAAPDKSRS